MCVLPCPQTIRSATKPMSDCLLMLKNEHWKRVRSVLTPSFSSAKMREVREELTHTHTHTPAHTHTSAHTYTLQVTHAHSPGVIIMAVIQKEVIIKLLDAS